MPFGLIGFLISDPINFFRALPLIILTIALSILLAITVHEFGHAAVANILGDRTARSLGRVSLNPLKHLDPLGTLFLVIVGFGWGKPVPVNPFGLKNARRDMALVALAGPLTNILLACAIGFVFRSNEFLFNVSGYTDSIYQYPINELGWRVVLSLMLSSLVFYNLFLGIFNLIPIAPLDGSKILMGILPKRQAESVARLEPYGPAIIILIVMLDMFMLGRGIFITIVEPFVKFFVQLSTGISFR
ncbi:MAG: site-2 protease family protein [Dehalococcoidia bacterium]|nr:site-2 protease family protein [Dehalococcoidia bacterium]